MWHDTHLSNELSVRFMIDSSGRTRFERICRRISNYDPKAIHRRLSARKAAGTNRWLLDRDDFQSWLRGDTNPQSHLWLSGKGKEAICGHGIVNVLNHLRSWLGQEHTRVSQVTDPTRTCVRGMLTVTGPPLLMNVLLNASLATPRPYSCSSSKATNTQPSCSSRA